MKGVKDLVVGEPDEGPALGSAPWIEVRSVDEQLLGVRSVQQPG